MILLTNISMSNRWGEIFTLDSGNTYVNGSLFSYVLDRTEYTERLSFFSGKLITYNHNKIDLDYTAVSNWIRERGEEL